MPLPNLPFYSQTQPVKTFELTTSLAVKPNDGYFRIRFVDMRIDRDWIAATTLVPALHTLFDLITKQLEPLEVVISPAQLHDRERGDRRSIYLAPQSLTPIIPHNGNTTKAQLGLFAVADKDLSAEMLGLLGVLLGPSQNPEILAALGIAKLLRQSVNALFGLDNAKMLLRWQGEIGGETDIQQKSIIVTSPDSELERSLLSISDGRLHYNNQPLERTTYMVFAVEVSNHRPDWRTLPNVRTALDRWNIVRSTYNPTMTDYNSAVSALLIALRNSPYLVQNDTMRIIAQEIAPTLKLDADQQSSLFRSAGIDYKVLTTKATESVISDFTRHDVAEAETD